MQRPRGQPAYREGRREPRGQVEGEKEGAGSERPRVTVCGFGSVSGTAARACCTRSLADVRAWRKSSGGASPMAWRANRLIHSFCRAEAALLMWSTSATARVVGGGFGNTGMVNGGGGRLAISCRWRWSGCRFAFQGGGGLDCSRFAPGQNCHWGGRCGSGGGAIGASFAEPFVCP